MLRSVRKFLKNKSPDWLNTEVNKDLLQNISTAFSEAAPTAFTPAKTTSSSTSYDVNCSPSPELGEGLGERAEIQLASKELKTSNSDRSLSTDLSCVTRPDGTNEENYLQYPKQGTPHWRRIRQVYQALDHAPANATYNQLIEYVRQTTGKGCSRKLISKWKKQKRGNKLPDNSSGDRPEDPVSISEAIAISAASLVSCDQTIEREFTTPSITVNSLQLNKLADDKCNDNSLNRPALLPVKAWSYLTAAGIMVSLVGCEIIPFNNNRPTENVAIASVTAPIAPLTPIPERRKNRLEPRTIKIELTLSNPQDLKVKPGDRVSAGQVLSDRRGERNRLQAKKKQLQLSLEKLNLPLTPIPQPRPIPEIRSLPPVSYAEAEAAIKLKQQKLTEAEQAIAIQQKKIDSINRLLTNSPNKPTTEKNNLKLVIEHEQANLKNLEAARQSAQIQLEVQESKLTTAFEQRAYIEYQRQLEQTRRAIAVEQQHQAIASQKSERSRLLAEREYSQAQIETQIQTLDYQVHQLSTVTAPYEGTIKKVKWTGQNNHHLTAVVILAVNDSRSTIANSADKPTPNTKIKQTTQAQP